MSFKLIEKEELVTKLVSDGLPIIIYGAGTTGQALLKACDKENITIECFCDNNIKRKSDIIFNKEVIHTSEIKRRFPDANFLISSADIIHIESNLIKYGYSESRLYPGSIFLKGFDLSTFKDVISINEEDAYLGFMEFTVGCTIKSHEGYLDQNKIFMRSVDIVVTEKCTMKCVDCSNLMQFFDKPVTYTIEEMNEAVDLLCSFTDEIYEFRVIGGEPFVHKEVHVLIEKLTREPKVHRIVIYTNGNIIPKEHQIDALKHEKVLFNITDYSHSGDEADDVQTSKLSRFQGITDAVEQVCIDNNIDYRRHPPENWTDCGRIENFNRSLEEDKEIFNDCCCKNLYTLSKNELHRCPFSAQITRLGVCDIKEDYVVLTGPETKKEMRRNVRELMHNKDVLGACRFCTGRSLADPQITPAVQVRKPLSYEKHIKF